MKKLLVSCFFATLSLVLLVGCSPNKNVETREFTFTGQNNYIEVTNGRIVLSPESETFIGGNLSFFREVPTEIKEFTTAFYFYHDDEKDEFTKRVFRDESSEENLTGVELQSDLGSTEAVSLFTPEVWDIILSPGELHFSISGIKISGETFEYSVEITVTEVSNVG